MARFFHRLLFTLAGSSEDELRRQVQFLKAENEVLRARLGKQLRLTPAEWSRLSTLSKLLARTRRWGIGR